MNTKAAPYSHLLTINLTHCFRENPLLLALKKKKSTLNYGIRWEKERNEWRRGQLPHWWKELISIRHAVLNTDCKAAHIPARFIPGLRSFKQKKNRSTETQIHELLSTSMAAFWNCCLSAAMGFQTALLNFIWRFFLQRSITPLLSSIPQFL